MSGSSETELKNPISQLIMTTLDISFQLTQLNKGKLDLRMAYAKYLAINDTNETLAKMRRAGTWTEKSTSTDVVEVFLSTTVFHRTYSKIFPSVPRYPLMEKWLLNADGAPTAAEIWKGRKQTYENLDQILQTYSLEPKDRSGPSSSKKGKKHQDDSPLPDSSKGKKRQEHSFSDSEKMTKKKVNEKKKGNSGKKGDSSKSCL